MKSFMFWRRPTRRRYTDKLEAPSTRIAGGFHFQGEIRGKEGCRVEGQVIGLGDFEGTVILAPESRWQGEITADIIQIAGHFEGKIEARIKLELLSTARVTGDLNSPLIAIAEGANIEGTINRARKPQVTRYRERRGIVPPDQAEGQSVTGHDAKQG